MTSLLKYTPYLYLILAAFFLYDAVDKWQNDQNPILSFVFVAVAVFLFFFRRKFAKKMADRYTK